MSFLPLFLPFIIRLSVSAILQFQCSSPIGRYLRIDQSLNNGHTSLGELLLGVSTSSVGDVHGVRDVDVVLKGDIFDFDTE